MQSDEKFFSFRVKRDTCQNSIADMIFNRSYYEYIKDYFHPNVRITLNGEVQITYYLFLGAIVASIILMCFNFLDFSYNFLYLAVVVFTIDIL